MADSEVAGDLIDAAQETFTVGVIERASLTLDGLPDNVLHHIGMHLRPKHMRQLSMMNKRLHDVYVDISFKYKYFMKNFTCPLKKALHFNEPHYEVYELILKNATKLSQLWRVGEGNKILKGSFLLPRVAVYHRLPADELEKIMEVLQYVRSIFVSLQDLYLAMEALLDFDDPNITSADADLKLGGIKTVISALLDKAKGYPDGKYEIIREIQRAFMFEFPRATVGMFEGEVERRLISFYEYFYGPEVFLTPEQIAKLQKDVLKHSNENFRATCLKARFLIFLKVYGPNYKELITDKNFIEGIFFSISSSQRESLAFYLNDFLSCGDVNAKVQQLADRTAQVYTNNTGNSDALPGFASRIERILPEGLRPEFWQRIWTKLSYFVARGDLKHRVAFLLVLCFVAKVMEAKSIDFDYDEADRLIEKNFAWFLEGKDIFKRLDSILAVGFSCGISLSGMGKLYWENAKTYTSMRQALRFYVTFGLDPLQDVLDKVLMNKGSLDYIFSLVNAASYYIEDMEPILAVVKNYFISCGLSETFYEFVRTGNIDHYAFVSKQIFDHDLLTIKRADKSEWVEAFECLRLKANSGKYASLHDFQDQKKAYMASRYHNSSDSYDYGYGYDYDANYYDLDYDYY